MQEVNTMAYHDEPTPREKKDKNQTKNLKSYTSEADPSEYGCTYATDCLNLGEPVYDL